MDLLELTQEIDRRVLGTTLAPLDRNGLGGEVNRHVDQRRYYTSFSVVLCNWKWVVE